ncbi:hypothetical protein GXW82_35605 [Streptacidiphilus sp. 4-A2]|nr:hypothetical protein [Streptacidiphilus sp. 4-A2]
MAMHNQGLALMGTQCPEEAITAFSQAALIFQAVGDSHGEGMARNGWELARNELGS